MGTSVRGVNPVAVDLHVFYQVIVDPDWASLEVQEAPEPALVVEKSLSLLPGPLVRLAMKVRKTKTQSSLAHAPARHDLENQHKQIPAGDNSQYDQGGEKTAGGDMVQLRHRDSYHSFQRISGPLSESDPIPPDCLPLLLACSVRVQQQSTLQSKLNLFRS